MSKGMAGLAVVGCSVLLCSCPVAAYNAGTDLFSMDLEQLLQIEVYSPSRQLTKVAKAPAVITVISAEEIHKRGLKTLKEVLDRVRFFTMPEQSTYLISNRGFTQNPNGNYLLLLNNHPLNNQRTEGAEELHLFPNLAQVVRIEVIRGPGSTLWGADAAMGIINVITRTAAVEVR
ncbi:MAG: TonB-dependent receptor plug domain-containing protein [Rheinheimera sp.]|nr:TonB-dependent receptor plug domain-containing protein [Rheinheimera sp.]